jgi:electron transfer flavoprotein beta subunit
LTLVDRIVAFDPARRTITARRNLQEKLETVEAGLPALVSVVREINRLRYPSVNGRLEAREAKVPLWNNYLLKLDPREIGLRGSPTQVRRIFAPPVQKGEVIRGSGEERGKAVLAVLGKLRQWKIELGEE